MWVKVRVKALVKAILKCLLNCTNQLVCYNIADNCWEWPSFQGALPLPRFGHATIISGDTVYLFGGRYNEPHIFGSKCFNDLHALDMVNMEWRLVHGHTYDNEKIPPAREFHTLTAISGVQFNIHFKDGLNPRLNYRPIRRLPKHVLNPCLKLRLNPSLNRRPIRRLPKHVPNPCLKLRLKSSLKFQMSIELHPRPSTNLA